MKINQFNRLLFSLTAAVAVSSLASAELAGDPDLIVNGTVNVTPSTAVSSAETPTATPGEAPTIRDNGDGTSTVFTRNSSVAVEQTQTTAGGVLVQPNGNVTLAPQQVTTVDLAYNIYSQFDVDNATNTPISSTSYVAGYVDGLGNIVEIVGVPVSQPDVLDPTTWTIDLADPAVPLANITTNIANATSGGDLQVGGDATVDGTLAVGAVADVEAELGALAAEDTAIRGEFAAEDTAIRGEFAAEDTAIRGEFAAADIALGGRIDTEASTRADADTAIRGEFAAEDTAIRGEFAAADIALGGRIDTEASTRAAADTAIRSEFRSADSNLQSQISSNRSQIDGNTRGIAMVAAMTNTTIQAGMTQAIDFNLAQFEGETGFAFGYGYRINENLQLNAAGASTTDFEEAVGRIGVSYQW